MRQVVHLFATALATLSTWHIALAGDTMPPLSQEAGRARVVIVRDSGSVVAFDPRPERLGPMFRVGLRALTKKESIEEAWRSLVNSNDIIGIKVDSAPGPLGGTHTEVVASILQTLLSARIAPDKIIIWDKQLADLRRAGFVGLAERYGVGVASSVEAGYDENVFYEKPTSGRLIFGDHEFGKQGEEVGKRSFISNLVTRRITKIINVTPLRNHYVAGVSGTLWGLAMGSADNVLRFESSPERLGTAVPELVALPELGDRVVLNVVDALICQYEGEERTLLHYSAMLGELRLSIDPVALDVLSLREIAERRRSAGLPTVNPNFEIYSNASLLRIGVSDPALIDIVRVP